MPDSPGIDDGSLEVARRALSEQLSQLDSQLQDYAELVDARERVAGALAALDGGKATKKRVRWWDVAAYVALHPGARPAEIAAALEVPRANVQAHLARNESTVFESRRDGWHVLDGWESRR